MEKKLILCDTDVVIDFFDRDKPRHDATYEALLPYFNQNRIGISVVTVMEVMAGLSNKKDWKLASKQLAALNTFLLTPEISLQALGLMKKYRLSHGISIPDSLIAATSIELALPIFTYNQKHFKYIRGLEFWAAR